MNVDKDAKKLQKHLEQELLEDYKFDEKSLYLVKDDEKYDIIPEIINGKNVADYIDADIFEKLEELEKEEELREAAGVYDPDDVSFEIYSTPQKILVIKINCLHPLCKMRKPSLSSSHRIQKLY